ncbi:MAG TPA: PEGA domain-containing protein [Vicinamibacterales bacterium]|jgi:hypothetical protein|nr:PEGA domain-containing protein [Vicinamibacterales bacterium]
MERAAASLSAPPAVVFEDGLGERRLIAESAGRDSSEWLCLQGTLASVPSFEFALRERVGRLAQFRHPAYARVRSVERLNDPDATLTVVSDHVDGVRLSEMLANVESHGLPLDINAALCLIRQLAPAVALLHESARDAAHGAIGPERLIVTPQARLIVVEHVCGSALEQLRFSQERYWTELRVPVPRSAGPARFDQRTDVLQIGITSLSLVLGRLLRDEEFPARLGEVLASTWAVSARGGFEPLPAGLRGWLGRALQLDPRNAFTTAMEARDELDTLLGDGELLAPPASLEAFLAKYRTDVKPRTATFPPAIFAAAPKPVAVSEPPRPAVPIASLLASPLVELKSPAPLEVLPIASSVTVRPIARPTSGISATTTPPRGLKLPEMAPPRGLALSGPSTAAATTEPIVAAAVSSLHAAQQDHVRDTPAEEPPGETARWKRPPVMAAAVAALVLVAGVAYGVRKIVFAPAAAVSHMGTLVVTSDPSGAATIVDGEARGMTPMTLTLTAGPHVVELRAAGGGAPRSIPVTITEGTQSSQYIELPKSGPTLGQLQVRTEPAGADVTVDGVPRGRAPALVADLAAGDHIVVVTSELGSMKQNVTIEAGVTASLVMPLSAPEGAPVSGWISVSAPLELQVFEHDRLLGTSQTDRIMVAAGKHDFDFVNDTVGFRTTKTMLVAAGKTAAMKIDLPKGTIALNATPWAEVWIDGEKIGETPIGNYSLPIGSHDVVFRHPDLGEQHHTALVTLKEPARLSVDLRKK